MDQYIADYARMIVAQDPMVLGLDLDALETVVGAKLEAFAPSRDEVGLVAVAIDQMSRDQASYMPRTRRNKDPMFR